MYRRRVQDLLYLARIPLHYIISIKDLTHSEDMYVGMPLHSAG